MLEIMPAYAPMLEGTYYAWNYASIICQCLIASNGSWKINGAVSIVVFLLMHRRMLQLQWPLDSSQ